MGFTDWGGSPGLESFSKHGSARWADTEIFKNLPLSEFLGPNLSEVNLTLHIFEPWTQPLAITQILLNTIMDNGWPMPLFVGSQIVGRGAGLYTLRSVREVHEIITGRTIKARLQVSLKEYATPLSSFTLLNIAGKALALL